jgi:ubiquitin carboxyl-terminal hydrolase 5/13
MASVLQVLFSIPSFKKRYYDTALDHHMCCNELAPKCFDCQMSKLAQGLLSGDFSIPIQGASGEVQGQQGISPAMFKGLVGGSHPEFASMRQQVSLDFENHMVKDSQTILGCI